MKKSLALLTFCGIALCIASLYANFFTDTGDWFKQRGQDISRGAEQIGKDIQRGLGTISTKVAVHNTSLETIIPFFKVAGSFVEHEPILPGEFKEYILSITPGTHMVKANLLGSKRDTVALPFTALLNDMNFNFFVNAHGDLLSGVNCNCVIGDDLVKFQTLAAQCDQCVNACEAVAGTVITAAAAALIAGSAVAASAAGVGAGSSAALVGAAAAATATGPGYVMIGATAVQAGLTAAQLSAIGASIGAGVGGTAAAGAAGARKAGLKPLVVGECIAKKSE